MIQTDLSNVLCNSVYATDVNSMVACQSIKAVGTIALRIPSKANICIDQLISLLNLKVDYVTSEVVVVMKGKQHAYW